jgi:hypothetical protein
MLSATQERHFSRFVGGTPLLLKILHRDFAHYVKIAQIFSSARTGSGRRMMPFIGAPSSGLSKSSGIRRA